VVDEQGRKMSKSLGNTILPQQVIKESGAEVLRLWVSMMDYGDEVRVGKAVLGRTVEAYRKIRNTFRYLLATLADFDPGRHQLARERLQEVDRFALARYATLAAGIRKAYDAYDFQSVFQAINEFMTVDLSAFYLDVSKDRLYTFAADAPERRSAQTAQYVMADGLTRLVAPILSITADEIWRHLPGSREASVHLSVFPADTETWRDDGLVERWSRLLEIRSVVNGALEESRQQKAIGTALQARVSVAASGEDMSLLERHAADLPMLFLTSTVALERRDAGDVSVTVTRADGQKCPRCWRYVTETATDGEMTGLCMRCVNAVGGSLVSTR
jgi:isoleucyl-tRNA synthetase